MGPLKGVVGLLPGLPRRGATLGLAATSGVDLAEWSDILESTSGVEEGVPPSRPPRSGVLVLGVGIRELSLGGGVLAGERLVGVFPARVGRLPGMVGVLRRGIPEGLALLWTEEEARVTFLSSSIRGSASDFVLREVALLLTPGGDRASEIQQDI